MLSEDLKYAIRTDLLYLVNESNEAVFLHMEGLIGNDARIMVGELYHPPSSCWADFIKSEEE